MSFGERLQALRRENSLTQEEFAQELKVSRQAVSKWESARGYPEIEKIIYICNHYRVSMEELFQDEVPPRHHSEPADPPRRRAAAQFPFPEKGPWQLFHQPLPGQSAPRRGGAHSGRGHPHHSAVRHAVKRRQ